MQPFDCFTLTGTYRVLRNKSITLANNFSPSNKIIHFDFQKTCRIHSFAVLTLYRFKLYFNILDVQSTCLLLTDFILISEGWKQNKSIIHECCLNLQIYCYQSSRSGAFWKYFYTVCFYLRNRSAGCPLHLFMVHLIIF